ncbi:T5orf172 domain-containing protein [Hydrogenispora ethanolica]|uniref:T5orf172 domain-containing protein n=1 Tax=Hydrogenispora ethanolica TaxID=1082276 RepID=A0A4R1RZV7_HYDET|nr:GIY-YIG nuclease family protein [Hydrogenispora ethanolica]TCL72348.1 T5orf172 domain-containing protein [Hydrogenispora ethanolica]
MNFGYIYVLSNDNMPSTYKIGKTCKDDINERAKELSNFPGIPTPFKVEFSFYVPDIDKAEILIHKELQKYRINAYREFFKADIEIIKDAFGCLYDEYFDFISKFSDYFQESADLYYKKIIYSHLKKTLKLYSKININLIKTFLTFTKKMTTILLHYITAKYVLKSNIIVGGRIN